MITRQDIALYLDDLDTSIGRIISLTLLSLIVLSSGIFIAETYPLPGEVLAWLKNFDTLIFIIFCLEYFLRLFSSENALKFIVSPLSLIDLLVILPFFLGLGNIVFFRFFRSFRILRLIRFLELEFLIFRIKTEDGIILGRIFLTLFTIIFMYSGLIYQIEHPINPEVFRTFLDAFYFSVVTMTTVGFGDVLPISELGRCVTLLMIATGVALIPWQVGDLIKQLVKAADRTYTVCSGCGWSSHDVDAGFCKMCGTKLDRQVEN